MVKRPNLSVAEIKALLNARRKTGKESTARFDELQRQVWGPRATASPDPKVQAIAERVDDLMHGIMARRLKRNRRSVELISPRDCSRINSVLMEEIKKDFEPDADPEDAAKQLQFLENFLPKMFDNLLKVFHVSTPQNANLYEEHWRWIVAVVDLAHERNMTPLAFLEESRAGDVIARRLYSKREFLARQRRAFKGLSVMAPAAFKKLVLGPLLESVSSVEKISAKELRELKRELEAELEPELKKGLSAMREAVHTFIQEEAERIYAPA